jgi:predicted nicotinamide N-methyase
MNQTAARARNPKAEVMETPHTSKPWPVHSVQIKAGPLLVHVDVISSFDDVLDAYARTHPDETDKIPYFADIWPSAIALANYIANMPALVKDQKVIELGCGLGLPSIVAAKCGAASVTATDFHPACIPYCQANMICNNVPHVTCRTLDWRSPDLQDSFNCILGSDLLYEEPQINALLSCIAKIQSARTQLVLADPLRKHIQAASDQLNAAGWQITYHTLEDILILDATHQKDSP